MRAWAKAWVLDRLDDYAAEGDSFAARRALRTTCKTVPVALGAMVLVHLLLEAFGLLPYRLADALAVGAFVTVPVTAAVTFVFSHAVGKAIQALAVSRDEFERLSATDLLSGLENRRAFFRRLEDMREDALLAIFDIDRFKRINDTYGHMAGDEVIRGVARILTRVFAESEGAVARLGGEEFAVLLRGRFDDGRAALVEAARAAVAAAPIETDAAAIRVTVSAGVAELRSDRGTLEVYRLSDQALYCAKAAGRNRVAHERDIAALTAGADAADRSDGARAALG